MTQITNDILHVEAKTVPLGADVWANDGTGWHGLRGRAKSAESFIKNGHTETVIHCDFEAPASAEMWERLKENFTAAYGRKTPVNEIPLKDVHIGTGCLEPIAAALPEPEGEICVLIAYSLLGGYHRSDPTTGGRVSLFPAGGTDSGWRGAYHHGALSGGASAYRPGCD